MTHRDLDRITLARGICSQGKVPGAKTSTDPGPRWEGPASIDIINAFSGLCVTI